MLNGKQFESWGKTEHKSVLVGLCVPEQYLERDLADKAIDWSAADPVANNRCAGVLGNSKLRTILLTCHGNSKSPGADSFVNWEGGNDAVFGSIFVKGSVTASAGSDIGNVVWEQDSVSALKGSNLRPLTFDLNRSNSQSLNRKIWYNIRLTEGFGITLICCNKRKRRGG